jgi:hypothetical protein
LRLWKNAALDPTQGRKNFLLGILPLFPKFSDLKHSKKGTSSNLAVGFESEYNAVVEKIFSQRRKQK